MTWPLEQAGAQARPSAPAEGRAVYRNVTVITPNDAVARERMAIVVQGERITAVVPVASLTAAHLESATVWEGNGAYALPGLMDVHVHLATSPDRVDAEREFKRLVYSGVTSARDMAGDARSLAELSRMAMMHEVPAPDFFYSALMAGPSFFSDPRPAASAAGLTPGRVPWMQEITDTTDIPLAVARARGSGATGIKVYANLAGGLVERIIAEGKRQGIPVWTHLQVYPATPYHSLGATAVSHVAMAARWILEPGKQAYGHANHPPCEALRADHPELVKYFAQLARSGTILDATLSLEALPGAAAPPRGRERCPGRLIGELVAAAARAGVPIAAGTDRTTPPEAGYPALHDELEALVKFGGLSPRETITAATLNGARTIGRECDYGTIEEGKYASLVFVRGNPLTDVANLRTVVLTVKRGKQYPRASFGDEGRRGG
jgi:hypothetical protein